MIGLHICTHWFLPDLTTRIVGDAIRTIYFNRDIHRLSIFPPSIGVSITIHIIEWIIRISSYSSIIPVFPRIVLYCGDYFCGFSSKVSHVILWFKIEVFPRIFSTICKLDIWCKVKRTTLTLHSTTIGVGYIRTLKNLNSLVSYRARTIGNWISSS